MFLGQKVKERIFEATTLVLFIGIIIGGFYLSKYYSEANQTEETLQVKTNKAVTEAEAAKEAEVKAAYEKKMADEAANPWKTYTTEDVFGPITFKFPKDWHSRADKDMQKKEEFVFMADPDWIVDDARADGPFPALLVKIVDAKYEKELSNYEGRNRMGRTVYTIEDTTLAGVNGSRLYSVNEDSGKNIAFIIIPYRDKTFYIGTEDRDRFEGSFNEILGTLSLNK